MKTAHFYCYGVIGEADPYFKVFTGESDPIISSMKVSEFLQGLSSDVTDIVVHINSRGGSVDEGFTIHDLFKSSGKTITTIVEGMAASIASIVLFAGSKREITPNSKVMIHNPWIDPSSISGLEADEVAEVAASMKNEETRILDFYANNTGADRETIKSMMKAETEMTADAALELKFVTSITSPVKALAFTNNKFQTSNKMSKTLDAMMAKLDKVIDYATGKIKKLDIKAEGGEPEIVAEDFTTAEGNTIKIDGGLAEGSMVSDAEGNPMPEATITLSDGTVITTDAESKITSVTAVEPDPNQAAIDAAVAEATKDLTAQIETLKTENDSYKAAQAEMGKKIDLIAKSIGSNFVMKTAQTKFASTKKDEGKEGAISVEEMRARKAQYKQAKQN